MKTPVLTGLDRLLRPKTIAVIGGGAWCANVIKASEAIGFSGKIWPVHPSKTEIAGKASYPNIDALPSAPDATFLGVNRYASIECLSSLSKRGAGGAVCFASGFAEASAELADGADLQAQLLQAAGEMTVLGPNCYGMLNYLDGVALWPDQHGGERVETGVAIITQSSNIAINLTMQNRAVPLAYMLTAGNQAQTDLASLGMALLRDPRVTCLGLHIEGINDISKLEELANLSHELGKPICAVKIGASDQAQLATVSHTASLAGSHTGAKALLTRLGIAQPQNLAAFLELLKIWHVNGPLPSGRIASASCSGGEASLMADSAQSVGLQFPALSHSQSTALNAALGPKVALANPLDYHTYIWPDPNKMSATFAALFEADIALGIVVLDFPRSDRCALGDWDFALEAILSTKKMSKVPIAVLSSLPDTMPEMIAKRLISQGIVPLHGMDHALQAIALAQRLKPHHQTILHPITPINAQTLNEYEAKHALHAYGLEIPRGNAVDTADEALRCAAHLQAPFVLKGMGLAHKSEAGAVRVGLSDGHALQGAMQNIKSDGYLVEEMVKNGIVEILLAVTLDPAHGYVLTLGAGGTQTELLQDTVSLILPVTEGDTANALGTLRIAPVLDGYRGAQAIDRPALWRAIQAVQNYVIAHHGQVQEVEINPLICTANSSVAVDALIVLGEAP